MPAADFEAKMRRLLRQEPFQPFVVEMLDGRLIWILMPNLALGGGGASFFTPEDDFIEIACEDVCAIRQAVPGAAL
jgi:hypothetical protein